MKMGDLGPLVQVPGLGQGVRLIVPGEAGHVLVTAGDKMVHLYSLDTGAVTHTWCADTGSRVTSVAGAGQRSVILLNKRIVVTADKERNKIEDCEKMVLSADVYDIVTVDGNLWVVFTDGSVEQLDYFTVHDKEDWETVKGILTEGQTILDTRLRLAPGTGLTVSHLVSENSMLSVVTGRLVLDTLTGTHSLAGVTRTQVDITADNLAAWHIDPWARLFMVTRDTSRVLMFSPQSKSSEEINSLSPGSKHVALTHVSEDQVAVMGSLSEGGYLHTLSTVYRCTVATASMKTTSHSGKGMFVVDDKLFVCVGNRVMSVKPGPGGLDTVLGKMAVSVSSTKPRLDEETVTMSDMPESVTVECVLALLETEEEAAQLDSLRALVRHELSQPVLSQLLTQKLSLEQTIR